MNKDNQEKIVEKTLWDKAKETFGTALMSAGIVLVVLLIIWIPFKVIPAIYSNGTNFVATTLSSMLVPAAATTTSAVTNSSAIATTSKNSAPTYYVQPQVTYYGKSDLEVSLISTGIIDPASKQYIATNYAGYNDEVAIRFQVKNIGTNVTGPWTIRINTPSRTTPYYDSAAQQSIRPGDKIIFTTSFDSPVAVGINTAYITADPLNMIDEVTKSNNEISVPINIQGTYYSYNNNYNYGNTVQVPNVPYGTLYSWVNMNVDCYANPQSGYIGNPVTWYATASGGNGYFSYAWTGSDLLNSNESAVSKTYYSSGTKYATVTVTSNGVSVTKQCSVIIN